MNCIMPKRRNGAAALLALFLLSLSCATTSRERYSSDECLVLVKTEVKNPQSLPVGRKYALKFADGTFLSIGDKDFVSIKVYEPGMRIVSISSNVESEYKGSASRDKVDIALPYVPGEVAVADFVFVHELSKKEAHTIQSSVSFREIEPQEAESLVSGLRSDGAYATWFTQPAVLGAKGFAPPKPRPSAAVETTAGYGSLSVEADTPGMIAVDGVTRGPIVPGTPLVFGDITEGDHSVMFSGTDGRTDSAVVRTGAKTRAQYAFIAGVTGATASEVANLQTGQGYTMRTADVPKEWLRGVRVFRDGEVVYFVIDYLAERSTPCSFFDPPGGTYFKILPNTGIRTGTKTIVFAVSVSKLGAAGHATMLTNYADANHGGMLYFQFPSGCGGLPEAMAPQSIRAKAFR